MFIYWIYAIISIISTWILYKITEKYKYPILFYFISLFFILFYYLLIQFVKFYYYLKYRKELSILECNKNRCEKLIKENKQEKLCENVFNCDNHYLCKRPNEKSGNCEIKGNCLILIKLKINEIEKLKNKEFENTMQVLNNLGLHKDNLDEFLKICLLLLLFIFLLIILFLVFFDKLEINLDLSKINNII